MAQGDYNCNLLFQKSSNKALGLILVYITFDITTFEIFQIIFDYEELLKLRPLIEEGTEALISQDINFNDFLIEWDEMRKNTITENLQMKNLRIGSSNILRSLD
ncbi:hypothetical protein [Wansuia hejianensis]|uniref:hypothetical protein n=1 Tax=Wansuia hejianensis TaxID=2763667 RepID=UPI002016A143|nr:hypothetical protein [Wansuia hejianensis]